MLLPNGQSADTTLAKAWLLFPSRLLSIASPTIPCITVIISTKSPHMQQTKTRLRAHCTEYLNHSLDLVCVQWISS
jgi:hypothetical protein